MAEKLNVEAELDRLYGGPPEEFRKKIDGDITLFADVVKAANLKFEE